jgi:uncharacterized protein (DUF952 family)
MGQESLPARPNLIYHMCAAEAWHARRGAEYSADYSAEYSAEYSADSLADEGFIHLSGDAETLLMVANSFYRGEAGDWVILVVEADKLAAPLQWDPVGERHFPHLYGPLNADAVVQVAPFPRAADGEFLQPHGLLQSRGGTDGAAALARL